MQRVFDFMAASYMTSPDTLGPSPLPTLCDITISGKRLQRDTKSGTITRDAAVTDSRNWPDTTGVVHLLMTSQTALMIRPTIQTRLHCCREPMCASTAKQHTLEHGAALLAILLRAIRIQLLHCAFGVRVFGDGTAWCGKSRRT